MRSSLRTRSYRVLVLMAYLESFNITTRLLLGDFHQSLYPQESNSILYFTEANRVWSFLEITLLLKFKGATWKKEFDGQRYPRARPTSMTTVVTTGVTTNAICSMNQQLIR